jgi:lysophospholipase L1-like esterase
VSIERFLVAGTSSGGSSYTDDQARSAVQGATWIAHYPALAALDMDAPPDVSVGAQNAYGAYYALPGAGPLVLGAAAAVNGATDSQFMYPQNITPLNGDQFAPWALEFVTDAPLFDLHVRSVSQSITVYVDGQRAATVTLPGGGGNNYVAVDSTTRRMRHFRFESNDLRSAGIVLGAAADSVIRPGRRGPRVAVVGDSYTEGTGATTRTTAYPWVMARAMGWSDIWQSGSGGTGYLATGPSPRVKYRDRIDNDVLDHDPDLVIVTGGRNDAAFSDSAVGAEALLLFQQIAATGAALVVVGPWFHGTPDSVILSRRDAIEAACATAGGLFLDPLDPPLVTGTGNVGDTNNDGNADFLTGADAVHPTQDGHDALGLWLAARLADAWRA